VTYKSVSGTKDATTYVKVAADGSFSAATPAGSGGSGSGPYGSLPAAGSAGALYIPTDIPALLRDTGSTWDRFIGGAKATDVPTSGWTTSLGGSSTVAANKDGRLFTVPSVAGVNWRLEYRTLSPTSNYTFTVYIESALYQSVEGYGALILRNSSSGSFIVFGHAVVSPNGFQLASVKYTNTTTGVAVYASQTYVTLPGGQPNWLRVRDDGTNRFFEYSYNGGVDWQLHYSTGRTDFITPDQIGWGAHASGGQTNYARLRSWSVV
jgi:hypothetical protein